MKKQGSYRLFALMLVFVFVSLACYGGGTPTPAPIQQQQQQQQSQPTPVPQQPTPVPQQDVQPTPEQQSTGGLTTFTDQNKYYAIDIPSDWAYSQTVDSEKNYYYIDTFTSPDQMALVENIVYDDGKPFTGNDKSKFSLYLLNTFYSKTGKEGDIRVSDYSMMQDGSERMVWTSKAGGYSGITFLETRGTNTFLLFTVEWVNSAEDQYKSTLDKVIASYRVP